MKIYAPNKQYTGTSASVPFCNGVGETNDPRLLRWFRSHGYEVEDLPSEKSEAETEDPGKEPDKEPKKGKAAIQKAGE